MKKKIELHNLKSFFIREISGLRSHFLTSKLYNMKVSFGLDNSKTFFIQK